jgi:phosphoserine phosphatase
MADIVQENHHINWPMIVFDFDKTLTYRDTTLPFLAFGLSPIKSIQCHLRYYFLALLVKCKCYSVLSLKQTMINWRFRQNDIQTWKLHCKAFSTTIKTNALYRQTNWSEANLVIASASFKEVLVHLFPSSVLVIGSEVGFGKQINITKHAMGEQKAILLRDQGIESFDRLYTDSLADLPLMKMASEVIWVKGDHQKLLTGATINKLLNNN